MINVKDTPYNVSDSNIVLQPKFDNVKCGKTSLNTTAHIDRILLPNDISMSTEISTFANVLTKSICFHLRC